MQRISRKNSATAIANSDGTKPRENVNGITTSGMRDGLLIELVQAPYVLEIEEDKEKRFLRLFCTDGKKWETSVFILDNHMANVIGNELIGWSKRQ